MSATRNRGLPAIKESPKELKALMASQTGSQYHTRLMLLYFAAAGKAFSRKTAAALAGCTRKTAAGWFKAYAAGGLEAVLAPAEAGRGRPGQLPEDARDYIGRQLSDPHNCPKSWAELRRRTTLLFPNTLSYNTFINNVRNWYPGVKMKAARPVHPKKPADGPQTFKKN